MGCSCFGPSTRPKPTAKRGLGQTQPGPLTRPGWTLATSAPSVTTALGYLREQTALVGDEHTATRAGAGQHHGYAAYFFTRQGVRLLEG